MATRFFLVCTALATALLSTTGAARAPSAPVDFTGTWVLDRARSELPRSNGGGQPAQDAESGQPLVLVITQTATEVTITREGRRGTATMMIGLDGRETTTTGPSGGTLSFKSIWEGTTLVSEGHQQMTTPRGTLTVDIREERSLSADGRMLTVRTITTGPRGRTVRRMVFVKRN